MSVTQKIIVVPNEVNSFLDIQRAAMTAIKELCQAKVNEKMKKTDFISSPAQLFIRSREEKFCQKHGAWKTPNVSSYDFESFNICFGMGDENYRRVFSCESFDNYDEIENGEHKNICFLINQWGSYAEILDVIGEACIPFGKVYRLNNDYDIVKTYAETKTAEV